MKQTKKGWVSVTKLPSGKWMAAAFLESRVNPIQKVSGRKADADKNARAMIRKYL